MGEELIRKSDAIEAVQKCCPDTAMYRAIRDIKAVGCVYTIVCEQCEKCDYCDIHNIHGARYCSLGKAKESE